MCCLFIYAYPLGLFTVALSTHYELILTNWLSAILYLLLMGIAYHLKAHSSFSALSVSRLLPASMIRALSGSRSSWLNTTRQVLFA